MSAAGVTRRAAYRQGEAFRAQGTPCNCPDCVSTHPATGTPRPAPAAPQDAPGAPTKAITILTGPISL